MAYVYGHYRKDNGELFYVGMSNDDERKNKKITRAFTCAGRNQYWHEIVAQTDFEVKFFFKDVDADFAVKKELELIRSYGISNKGGLLANRSIGNTGLHWNKPEGELMVPLTFLVFKRNKEKIKAKLIKRIKLMDRF